MRRPSAACIVPGMDSKVDVDGGIATCFWVGFMLPPRRILSTQNFDHSLAEDVYRRNWRYRAESIDIDTHTPSISPVSGVNSTELFASLGQPAGYHPCVVQTAQSETPSPGSQTRHRPNPLWLGNPFRTHGGCAFQLPRSFPVGVLEISSPLLPTF